jgi:hypothetical protein
MPENNGTSRLDRIERALELLVDDHVQFREEHQLFREEHKMLLTAQVLLTEAQKRTDEKLAKLAVTVDEVAGKLNALIEVVDGLVRNPPRS